VLEDQLGILARRSTQWDADPPEACTKEKNNGKEKVCGSSICSQEKITSDVNISAEKRLISAQTRDLFIG